LLNTTNLKDHLWYLTNFITWWWRWFFV